MSREIKFRGMTNNGWVYGQCVVMQDDFGVATPTIYDVKTDKYIPVHEETVGQYTGIKDKNGKEIYEGDILKTWTRGFVTVRTENGNTVVTFKSGAYIWINLTLSSFLDKYQVVVIGNIYENEELLKDE